MKKSAAVIFLLVIASLAFGGCNSKNDNSFREVVALPVYGQSLAIAEEAPVLTNFTEMENKYGHRIKTYRLDENFGHYANSSFKQWIKRVLNVKYRAFESSGYGAAETLLDNLDKEGRGTRTIVVVLKGGQGSTGISDLRKGSKAYRKFISELKVANRRARRKGWSFRVPAICWMQGETDIANPVGTDYFAALAAVRKEMSDDIKSFTGQKDEVIFICYQSNNQTMSKTFNPDAYNCPESEVPQAQMSLIKDSRFFVASGPTYCYPHVREFVHIDSVAQKRLGALQGLSASKILKGELFTGLIPGNVYYSKDTVTVAFIIPSPPLTIDSTVVKKVKNYGFKVVSKENKDIAQKVFLDGDAIKIICSSSPKGCKVRYGFNGEDFKMGPMRGARGNLRDSQGDMYATNIKGISYPLHNWCYQFDILIR